LHKAKTSGGFASPCVATSEVISRRSTTLGADVVGVFDPPLLHRDSACKFRRLDEQRGFVPVSRARPRENEADRGRCRGTGVPTLDETRGVRRLEGGHQGWSELTTCAQDASAPGAPLRRPTTANLSVTAGSYTTPAAFKQALETLKSASSTGLDFARRRQLVIFQRFDLTTVDAKRECRPGPVTSWTRRRSTSQCGTLRS
jgi:hypothetical protein